MSQRDPLHELWALLNSATYEQRENFARLTQSGFGSDPGVLCNHVRFLRAGLVGQVFHTGSWKQVVTDVADHVGVDWQGTFGDRKWYQLSAADIETAVVVQVFQNEFDRMTPQQQEQTAIQMGSQSLDPNLTRLLLTGGAMAVAKASGFGVYLIASTVLGGLTNALGITLPFVVYMGVSRAISVFLGPLGWLALLGGLAFTLDQPKWDRLILAVTYVSVIRHTPVEP